MCLGVFIFCFLHLIVVRHLGLHFMSELCYVNKLLLIEWVKLKGQVNRQE